MGPSISRRQFLASSYMLSALANRKTSPERPNVILMNADDLGYGDLGCYGSRLPTPNLDAMAREGVKFNQYNSASGVCSPSRAALLTGRYPPRTGVTSVLFPGQMGLPASETTLAESLKAADYKTMCIGKWHLGSTPGYLPTDRGFDEFFGVYSSTDMFPLPLVQNTAVAEERANVELLTPRYTEQAVRFIQRSRDQPFFLYLAHSTPHLPLAPSRRFKGASKRGPYGDCVAELDWSVGEVRTAVRDLGLADRTVLIFTSDNGPWYQGSPGNLRGRKGDTWEGGVRVPFIVQYADHIPAGAERNGLASALDIMPTITGLCRAPLPGHLIDGVDLWPLVMGEREQLDRDALLYFNGPHLEAARRDYWKLHVARMNAEPFTTCPSGGCATLPLPQPELYRLDMDPSESEEVLVDYPDLALDLKETMERHLLTFGPDMRNLYSETARIPIEYTAIGARPQKRI